MNTFNSVYQALEQVEGGYVYPTTSTDRGGETFKGISRKFFPRWDGWLAIDILKKEHILDYQSAPATFKRMLLASSSLRKMVKTFYKNEFWDKIKLDEIKSSKLQHEMFDTCVNQGSKTSIKYLQEALNLLNNKENLFKDLTKDGIIGNKSLNALKIYLESRPVFTKDEKVSVLLKILNTLQGMQYIQLSKKDESQEANMFGWFRTRVEI